MVDLMLMNSQCMEDTHPLPHIHDIFSEDGKKENFLCNGFDESVPSNIVARRQSANDRDIDADRPKQWSVEVMGWKNGVPYCQRIVETMLELVSDIATVYLDDIIAVTDGSHDEYKTEILRRHDADIRKVLDETKKAHLVVDRQNDNFSSRKSLFAVICKKTEQCEPSQENCLP
jgi:hypothetical protein